MCATALALDDALITIKLTPNRADCLSLVGIAREVAAITGAPLELPPIADAPMASTATRGVRDRGRRSLSALRRRASSKASTPARRRPRGCASGSSARASASISAIVDITNYVMLELGQPLHAYDNRLLDGDIVVRFARRRRER